MAEACRGPGDPLTRYDGAGLKADGYFCVFDWVSMCHTNTVEYDGAGLKPFGEDVVLDGTCTGKTFVEYDGTGLKASSYTNRTCGTV